MNWSINSLFKIKCIFKLLRYGLATDKGVASQKDAELVAGESKKVTGVLA